ncbi:phage protein Gp37/Gp68 domain protein [Leptospira interrogans serovar Zanoni str. LT2156]|uniref:Phage protein Gp37/Gp68 domain protein n=1 Tax=Leptospira interrogans serovar Zanoni str. LT2156 TaxID=1001601 RepID=M6I3N0_LEPIR|nr:phage protein Gp37/Gp68 domain protein [Leptospira interrogans serovar Zanoni str. LT2156]
MKFADWHIYQVLTKRPERMKKLFDSLLKEFSTLKHIWCGVNLEDQKNGLPRIKTLQETNISTRFLSIEPLLEDLGKFNLKKIDWVIVGGESGLRSRPIEENRVISIKEQCKKNRVPFFFKQWGWVRKHTTRITLLGKTFNEFPKIQKKDTPMRSKILDKLRLIEQIA